MAFSPIQLKPKQSGGKGGLFGKILGGVAGAIGGTFAGQPLAGAALGSKVGGTIGGLADPAKQSGGRGTPLLTAAEQSPMVQKRQLLDIVEDVQKASDLDEQKKQEVYAMFNPAIDALNRRS